VLSGSDAAAVQQLIEVMRTRGLTLAVAEGDTGGLALAWLTALAGSSAVVLGGVVAYHDDLKRSLLSVPSELISTHGSVSEQAAVAMASGVRSVTGASLGLAATGIAGPGGATDSKPVGLAWLAVTDGQRSASRQHLWPGDRAENRAASARALLDLTLEFLQ
jgi:PncC family amidohydrolase